VSQGPADAARGLLASFGPGSRLAGYVLEEQVGAGAMAVVFRAVDERLGRRVALKILAPALAADQAFRQRFIRESRTAAAVDDPYIIPVYEAGEADGVLFIAMRLVPGKDVKTLLHEQGPLPPGRVAAIIGHAASALDAAHAAGLVHRDVKPANMLIDIRPGRLDHVYLADFGISKSAMSSVGLTGTGQVLGTPDYMAPEQIEGGAVDGRADQYALACAAFELLAGRPPFQRDQGVAVIWAHLSVPPPALGSLRPGLPEAADAVFARALAKAPVDRFSSCQEFAAALSTALGLALGPAGLVAPASGSPAGGQQPVEPAQPAMAWQADAEHQQQVERSQEQLLDGAAEQDSDVLPAITDQLGAPDSSTVVSAKEMTAGIAADHGGADTTDRQQLGSRRDGAEAPTVPVDEPQPVWRDGDKQIQRPAKRSVRFYSAIVGGVGLASLLAVSIILAAHTPRQAIGAGGSVGTSPPVSPTAALIARLPLVVRLHGCSRGGYLRHKPGVTCPSVNSTHIGIKALGNRSYYYDQYSTAAAMRRAFQQSLSSPPPPRGNCLNGSSQSALGPYTVGTHHGQLSCAPGDDGSGVIIWSDESTLIVGQQSVSGSPGKWSFAEAIRAWRQALRVAKKV